MSIPQKYSNEKDLAIAAVREASQLCQKVRLELIETDSVVKLDASPVTIADFSAQALIARTLIEHFPDDPFIAEESASQLQELHNKQVLERITYYVQQFESATAEKICEWIDHGSTDQPSKRFWTLDPIDGTRGFLRDQQYAVALALIEDGEVKVGALACPNLPLNIDDPHSKKGVLVVAVKDQGVEFYALADMTKLKPHPTLHHGRNRLVESLEASHADLKLQEKIVRNLGFGSDPIKMDSQAKYAAVAFGEATVYLRLRPPAEPDYIENIWDHAAGSIVVQESGGIVTDSFGKKLDFSSGRKMLKNSGIVATRGFDHKSILDAIKRVIPDSNPI